MNTKSFRITGSDVFTAIQMYLAYYFAKAQMLKMMVSVQGMTINWLLCALIFISLNLVISIGLYGKTRSHSALQTLIIYAWWVVLLVPTVTIAFIKCAWIGQDTLILTLIIVAATIVSFWGRANSRSMADPVIRGILIGLFRVVPHLYLTYRVILAGSSRGLAPGAVWAANITAFARIATLCIQGHKSNWDKGTKAMLLAESANEGSWLLVTLMWYIYR